MIQSHVENFLCSSILLYISCQFTRNSTIEERQHVFFTILLLKKRDIHDPRIYFLFRTGFMIAKIRN